MGTGLRDNFTEGQVRRALELNAADVHRRWPALGSSAHYMCEECGYVGPDRLDFEVDHTVACARGGTSNPLTLHERTLIEQGDVEMLFRAGVQERVLCKGCNQAKKARSFVPPGAGYAFRRHENDRNPDHVHHGAPKVTARQRAEHPEPYDVKRYE